MQRVYSLSILTGSILFGESVLDTLWISEISSCAGVSVDTVGFGHSELIGGEKL